MMSVTLLQTVPGKPEWGTWSTDAPVVDWYAAIDWLFSIQKLLEHAVGNMEISVSSAELDMPVFDLSYHAAQGVSFNEPRCDLAMKSRPQEVPL